VGEPKTRQFTAPLGELELEDATIVYRKYDVVVQENESSEAQIKQETRISFKCGNKKKPGTSTFVV
jgi:hypothetical protein